MERAKRYWYLIFPILSLNCVFFLPVFIAQVNTITDIPLYPTFVINKYEPGAIWSYDKGKGLLSKEGEFWKEEVKCLNLTEYIGNISIVILAQSPWMVHFYAPRNKKYDSSIHVEWCGICWIKPKIWPPKFLEYYQAMSRLKCEK